MSYNQCVSLCLLVRCLYYLTKKKTTINRHPKTNKSFAATFSHKHFREYENSPKHLTRELQFERALKLEYEFDATSKTGLCKESQKNLCLIQLNPSNNDSENENERFDDEIILKKINHKIEVEKPYGCKCTIKPNVNCRCIILPHSSFLSSSSTTIDGVGLLNYNDDDDDNRESTTTTTTRQISKRNLGKKLKRSTDNDDVRVTKRWMKYYLSPLKIRDGAFLNENSEDSPFHWLVIDVTNQEEMLFLKTISATSSFIRLLLQINNLVSFWWWIFSQ